MVTALIAQDVPTVTLEPAEIDPLTTPVTITFDVTGTTMEGQTVAYLWAWTDGFGDAITNSNGGGWGDLSENAMLTPVDGNPNLFQFILPKVAIIDDEEVTINTIADLFGATATPGQLTRFGALLRDLSGDIQTDGDYALEFTLAPLIFIDSEFRTFPSKISNLDVATLYYNQNLSTDPFVQIMKSVQVQVIFLDSTNTELFASDSLDTNEDERVHSYTMLPEKMIPETVTLDDIAKLKAVFVGKIEHVDGTFDNISTEFEQDFEDYQ